MKCFIIVATTLDGFIAKEKDQVSTSWSSSEDRKHFIEKTRKAGVVIMGSTTYETFGRPLKDRLNIIYSKSGKVFEGTETTSLEPKELLNSLKERGYSEVAICGGSSIYTMFLRSGLVDTLYITLEPVIFGKGIPLFSEPLDISLELISERKTETGTIFLEYKIKK